MLKLKRQFSLLSLLVLVVQLFAQGPNGSGTYYSNANGQKGKSLKTALFKIISTHKDIGYDGLFKCYEKTDKRTDGKVWDMYSNTTNYSFSDHNGGYKKEGDMYNREHSLPQSWFKKASPMKADIVHVVPTDGYVNNRRSSYPFGETNNPTYKSNNGFSKVGPSSVEGYSGTVFEPNDEYKGDFARIYFYMATCYENRIASWATNGTASTVLDGTSYPAYKKWYINMLLRWAKEDPVSQKEIDRNNAVYECQKNRNPYVDYPGLEQYVWGDKQSVAFSYDNYDGTNPNPEPTPDPGPDPDPGTNPDPGTDPTPTDGYVFSKVTSTADVVPGSYYLIVCEGEKQALAEKNNDVRGNAAVTISNATITTTVDVSGKPRQLLLGGTADAYTFYDNVDKDYLALTVNDNKLQSSTSATNANAAQWTVTVSGDGVATIKNCNFTDREVRYNKSSPRFACYKGTQQTVSLYRRVQSTGIMLVKPSAADSRVDVFTVSGVLVRRQVVRSAALNGLAKGVYIIGGKKYAVE